MTQERDKDSEFEAYLQGKSGLSDLYADLPSAKLPEHLDAAILAEAHRAVHARPGGKPRRSWVFPLSMAASLFVAVILGAQLRYLLPVTTPAQPPQSAPGSAPPGPATRQAEAPNAEGKIVLEDKRAADQLAAGEPGMKKQATAAPAPGRPSASESKLKQQAIVPPAPAATAKHAATVAQETQDKDTVGAAKKEAYESKPGTGEQGAPAAAAAPPPAATSPETAPAEPQPEAAPMVAEESAPQKVQTAPEARTRVKAKKRSAERDAGATPQLAAAAPPVEAASAPVAMASEPQLGGKAASPSLEDWLARIRKLKQQGKLEEARKELAAFRKRYPDYAVPADLKGLAAR